MLKGYVFLLYNFIRITVVLITNGSSITGARNFISDWRQIYSQIGSCW